MSLPKVISGVGVSIFVVHVTNDPRPRYEVHDESEVVCVCDDEYRALSIMRALALTALLFEATVSQHEREHHR